MFFFHIGCSRLSVYGNNCDQPCSERCPGRRCDITNGACLSCPPGLTGHTCDESKECCVIEYCVVKFKKISICACTHACFFISMYQISVTQNVHLDHSVQIARENVKDIVEIHVITLVGYATTDVNMVGWDNTATNVSKYIYMII